LGTHDSLAVTIWEAGSSKRRDSKGEDWPLTNPLLYAKTTKNEPMLTLHAHGCLSG